jgi:hypothetical protein
MVKSPSSGSVPTTSTTKEIFNNRTQNSQTISHHSHSGKGGGAVVNTGIIGDYTTKAQIQKFSSQISVQVFRNSFLSCFFFLIE